MFSFHGLTGLDFRGSLEQLSQLRGVTAASHGRAIARVGDEHFSTFLPPHRHEAGQEKANEGGGAVQAYQEAQTELDRGPLYHAAQIMSREVVTLDTETPVQTAWQVLRQHAVRQAPVLDPSQALVGLVTERELLTALNLEGDQIRDVLPRRVAEVMLSPVLSADPDTDIRRVARAMLEFNLAAMPVVNEAGALLGLVTRGDILRAVVADPPLSLWG